MSDSRKSKSRARSKSSRHSYYDDHNDSEDSPRGAYYNSQNVSRRCGYSRSPDGDSKHQVKSHSSESSKKSLDNPQIKSLVKVPLPSLLSPPPLLSSGQRKFVREAQVVQNKSGLDRKSQFARSLLDLHFEDNMSHTPVHHKKNIKRKSEGKSLLSEPFDKQSIDSPMATHDDEVDTWLTPKETRRTLKKRSWRETTGGSAPSHSHSLFNSSYKTLVIESEPKRKMSKAAQKSSPKPLLEPELSPSSKPHSIQTSASSKLSPANLSKRHSPDSRERPHDTDSIPAQNLDKIVSFESAVEKNTVYLVIPSSLPWVHLHGRAKIEVVKGTVYILAHTLEPGTCYDVYSPSSSCLLSLQVDPGDVDLSPQDVKTELDHRAKDSIRFNELSVKSIGIIKVKKLDSVVCDSITQLPPFTKLFTPGPPPKDCIQDTTVGVTLFWNSFKIAPESEMSDPCMAWDDLYNDALDKWLETIDKGGIGDASPVLLTCGAKGSGKSTFNRCAVNMTLRTASELAYIDCDVGQTEFSPPATVSLHIIGKPVLSPPFCHQRHAEKMVFFGDVTPAQDPTGYVNCLHSVFKAYRDLTAGKKLPLIVNTMGFPEGIGYMLFIDTLNIARPDLVIQLNSEQPHANFPHITQEMIALDEGWTFNKSPPTDFKQRLSEVKEHFLFLLPSLNFNETTTPNPIKLHPADFRNLSMFSALCMGLSPRETLMSLAPHTVPYRNLAVHVCHYNMPPEELLVAIDASVVALCKTDLKQAKSHSEDLPFTFDDMPICECLGIGIVRGVEKGLLYVSTTVPRHMLKSVNTILKGTLGFPDHFIMNQIPVHNQIPYVDTLARATATHGHKARNRMPRLHTKTKTYFGL